MIDISNYCCCQCTFCGNASTAKIDRYRMKSSEIIKAAEEGKKLGIDVIHLAAGTDPMLNMDDLCEAISYISNYGIRVELALGKLSKEQLNRVIEVGASRFILKFETSNKKLFKNIKKCGCSLDELIEHIKLMKNMGFEVGSGNIIGLPGQTTDDVVKDIQLLMYLDLDMVSTSVFIPNKESEMSMAKKGNTNLALRYLALQRLLHKNKHLCIPSNSTFGREGKIRALILGANELSLNITPEKYAERYSIYSGSDRYKANFEQIERVIEEAGMRRTTLEEVFV